MQLFDRFNLGHGFRKYFEIRPATTASLRELAYRTRHEVYREQASLTSPHPDGCDTDAYDSRSLDCLLESRTEPSRPVGCVRIILCRTGGHRERLPFEEICDATLDRSIIDPAKLPRDSIAEISGIAVHAGWRRRQGERGATGSVVEEDFGTIVQPRFPYIPIGLYLGSIALAARSGIETLFILTEPRLASHFAKLGVDVRQIGGPVEHRGTRIPSVMDVQSIIKDMRFLMKPMWRVIQEEIEAGYERAAALEQAEK